MPDTQLMSVTNGTDSSLDHHHPYRTRRNRLIKRTTSTANMIQEEDSFRAAQCSSNSIFSAMDRFIQSVNEMDSAILIPSKLKDMDSDELLFNTLCYSPLHLLLAASHHTSTLSPLLSLGKSHNTKRHIASSSIRQASISNNNSVSAASATTNNNANTFACPYELYLMLKDVKKELLWGPSVLNGGGCDEASELLLAGKPQQQQPQQQQPLAPLTAATVEPASSNQHIISSSMSSTNSSTSSSIVASYSISSAETSGIGISDRDTDSDADSILNSDRDSSSSEDDTTTMMASSFRHHLLGLFTILHQLADTADTLTDRYLDEVERGGRR